MKSVIIVILLFGGCSSLLPAKFKKEKAMIQQEQTKVLNVKKT
jgi:hypothetical protein